MEIYVGWEGGLFCVNIRWAGRGLFCVNFVEQAEKIQMRRLIWYKKYVNPTFVLDLKNTNSKISLRLDGSL